MPTGVLNINTLAAPGPRPLGVTAVAPPWADTTPLTGLRLGLRSGLRGRPGELGCADRGPCGVCMPGGDCVAGGGVAEGGGRGVPRSAKPESRGAMRFRANARREGGLGCGVGGPWALAWAPPAASPCVTFPIRRRRIVVGTLDTGGAPGVGHPMHVACGVRACEARGV